MRRVKATKDVRREDAFVRMCRSLAGVECVREYRFHPVRMWRFDYAVPEARVAIEIDGGVWTQGRHTRPQGYLNDLEKFNAAALMGWVVLKFTPDTQYARRTFELIGETVRNRTEEIHREQ